MVAAAAQETSLDSSLGRYLAAESRTMVAAADMAVVALATS
jgi:hypothetical protein